MEEMKARPAFGVGVKRFLGMGYHPSLEVRPGTYKYSLLGPGCYDPSFGSKVIAKGPGWKRELEVEEFSRQLGYRREDILKHKMLMKSINGPAWHEVPPPRPDRVCAFSKGERFPVRQNRAFAFPGPGTYGKNHNPYQRREEKSRSKGYSHCLLPSFDQYSRKPRSLVVQLPYSLPPNLYTIKGSVDELISKRTSKKGPYDLFSGERFPDLPPQKYSPLEHMDRNAICNSSKGKFSKYGRDSLKTFRLALNCLPSMDESLPGPGYYNPYRKKRVTKARVPFNIGKDPRPTIKCKLHPPPGRYEQQLKRRILGNGMRSNFLSKTQRKVFVSKKFSWFE